MAYGEIKSVVRLDDSDAVTVIDTSSPKINNIGVKGYPMTKNDSGVTNSTGSSSTVVAKSEGITQASETLLSCANDLSNVLSKLSEVSTSISSNMSGFSQVEQIIKTLNNVISNKDNIVSKMKEFANYLTTVVMPGYNSFIKSLEDMDLDTSSLSKIDSLFGIGSVGGNVYNYGALGGIGGSIFGLMLDATGNNNQGDGTTYTQQDAYTGGPSSGARGTFRTKSSSGEVKSKTSGKEAVPISGDSSSDGKQTGGTKGESGSSGSSTGESTTTPSETPMTQENTSTTDVEKTSSSKVLKPSEANGRSTDSGSEFDATHTSPEDYPAVYVNNVDSHKHSDGKKIINDSASPTNVKVASSASYEVSKRTDTGTNYGTYDSIKPTPQPNSELFETEELPKITKPSASTSKGIEKLTDTGTGSYDSVRPTPQPNSELFE